MNQRLGYLIKTGHKNYKEGTNNIMTGSCSTCNGAQCSYCRTKYGVLENGVQTLEIADGDAVLLLIAGKLRAY